jgi:hypothetical protein
MTCCTHCAETSGWTYELNGVGDGIEFLDEVALLRDGRHRVTTVVLTHPTQPL